MALFIRIRPIDIGLKKSSAFPELPFPSAKVRIKKQNTKNNAYFLRETTPLSPRIMPSFSHYSVFTVYALFCGRC